VRSPVTQKLAGLGTSVFAEMSALALRHGAINLAQGFPDFDGPEFVKDAAIEAIRAGHGQYARTHGLPALNAAIARVLAERNGLEVDPEAEVTVTSGCTEAIFAAIAGSCDPGDEVILFQPFYDSYLASVRMAGAVPRVVTLRPTRGAAGGWAFDRDELRRAFTPATRGILVNTPHNPTGKVFSREELAYIAELCVEHDVICWADEVYERLVYDGEHVSIATLPGMRARTVTLSSLGKTFSLTGWKIGWAVAPPDLTRAVRAAHQFTTFCSVTPMQHAAIAALGAPSSYYLDLTREYRSKRDLLTGELARLGFDVHPPQGSYFVCAGIAAFAEVARPGADVAFCRRLVEEGGVAAIPPSAFYADPALGAGYVRFAFCKREQTLRAAVARLADALPRLRA
jgi:aspartate/methionine/tyrosine aminotransferase